MSARKKQNRGRARSQNVPPRIVAARGSFVMTREPGSEPVSDGAVMLCWSDGRVTTGDLTVPPEIFRKLEALYAAEVAA